MSWAGRTRAKAAILVFEQHDVTIRRRPCPVPRIVQQHERQQSLDRRPARQQGVEQAAEPDGFAGLLLAHQLGARRHSVAFGKDEIDNGQHTLDALVEHRLSRCLIGNPGIADLLLGAHQPLRHRLLADQEGARHGVRRQAADST
jgi:hypothetical protein